MADKVSMELLFTIVTYDKDSKYVSHPMISNSPNVISDILQVIKNYEQKGLRTEFVYINKKQAMPNSLRAVISRDPKYILC